MESSRCYYLELELVALIHSAQSSKGMRTVRVGIHGTNGIQYTAKAIIVTWQVALIFLEDKRR